MPRSEFLTRLVETYDRRKAAALFNAFKKNGTWQVPTFGALRSVWDARRAQLNPDDAAATDSAAKKTVEMFADMRKAGVKVLAGSDLPVSTGELRRDSRNPCVRGNLSSRYQPSL
jgi:imidazolonepropionase-like amidohydrolase